jgi:nicotinamidase-related amidase
MSQPRFNLREILNPKGSALVVWDVQQGLVNSVFNREEFTKALNVVINAARRVKVPIIYTKITPFPQGFEPYSYRVLYGNRRWSPRDLQLAVRPGRNEIVVNKNTWSLFVGTNVEMLLRNAGIRTVVFTGIATEVGVETSARHAFALGFMPVIVRDAVSSFDREAHERSLANMAKFFPVVTSGELANLWK